MLIITASKAEGGIICFNLYIKEKAVPSSLPGESELRLVASKTHWTLDCFTPLSDMKPRGLPCNQNSTPREKNTFKLPTSNSNSAASRAQGEGTRFCQFVPSVPLVQLIQAVGSAARLCKDHSQHLFTPDYSLLTATLPWERG